MHDMCRFVACAYPLEARGKPTGRYSSSSVCAALLIIEGLLKLQKSTHEGCATCGVDKICASCSQHDVLRRNGGMLLLKRLLFASDYTVVASALRVLKLAVRNRINARKFVTEAADTDVDDSLEWSPKALLERVLALAQPPSELHPEVGKDPMRTLT